MRRKSVYRGILIIAGLLAAAVIVFSHSLHELQLKKVTETEQSDKKSDQKAVISAPAEAVTQANAVKIDEDTPDILLATITRSESVKKYVPSSEQIFSRFFRVLFRIVIAPNAP